MNSAILNGLIFPGKEITGVINMPAVNGNLPNNKDLKYYDLANFDRNMVKLHNDFKILDDPYINRIYENNSDKVVAFMRGELLFVFNFHPAISYTDYGIPVKGKFRMVLDTDDPDSADLTGLTGTQYISQLKKQKGTL